MEKGGEEGRDYIYIFGWRRKAGGEGGVGKEEQGTSGL